MSLARFVYMLEGNQIRESLSPFDKFKAATAQILSTPKTALQKSPKKPRKK